MQILINGKGRPGAVDRPSGMVFPPDLPIDRLAGMIGAHHHPIADAFGQSAGLRLMRRESDIAFEIVGMAAAEGWTVLSVHDSFITTDDQQDRLKGAMVEAYASRLGMEPVLKK